MEVITKSERETKKVAEILAREILKSKIKKPLVLALKGNLGSGKTTFLKGLAKGFKIKDKILSPTFIILKRFEIKNSNFKNFYHLDCYRIKKVSEILKLGFKKIISDPKNIVAVEWSEKIEKILPRNSIWLNFEILGKKERKIKLKFFSK